MDSLRQVEPEDILEPAFMRRQMSRHVELDLTDLTLRDMMQCVVVAHDERYWIMALIAGVMWHLGMDHPPFPLVGLAVPPHCQPRGAFHDGVGT